MELLEKLGSWGCICLVAAMVGTCASCDVAKVDGDEEGVFTLQPYFFGTGGVDYKPLKEGTEWYVPTTKFTVLKVSPQQYEEEFDDIITNNNTPVDLGAYLTLQIKKGNTPLLIEKFGEQWYENNIQQQFRQFVRNEISKYEMFILTSDREVYATINANIESQTRALFETKKLPVDLITVIIGRAKPNREVLEEMNKTGAAIQAKETQNKRKEAEDARANSEKARAIADKAYINNMNLSMDAFIALRNIEINKELIEICKTKGTVNVDFMIGSPAVMPQFHINK
jgi:regulator of protease activity HflC (stomatin/prohibitin superfamily)